MKSLFIFLMLIIFISNNFGQVESAPAVELFFITESAPSSPIITCTLAAQSQCWGDTSHNSNPPGYGEYFLTDDFDEVTYIPQANNMGHQSAGFEFIAVKAGAIGSGYSVFAYGLYKVTINATNKYFYLDYRDYRIGYYSYYSPPTTGHVIDLWIKYRYDQDIYYYSSTGLANDFHIIEAGQLLNFWDIKQKGLQLTSQFPDYWENCLAVINDDNDHPKLVWGPYPADIGVYEYRIYRQYGGWHHFATVNSDQYMFVDTTVYINPPGGSAGTNVYYYVKGVYTEMPPNPIQTNPTNTVVINISGKQIDKTDKEIEVSETADYSLFQNYPNPFNPGTIINYTVAANSLVTIKVYDILGNEVAELVNSNKAPGNYSVTFDASGLSSGLYLYQLKAGGYSITKKMLVTK